MWVPGIIHSLFMSDCCVPGHELDCVSHFCVLQNDTSVSLYEFSMYAIIYNKNEHLSLSVEEAC